MWCVIIPLLKIRLAFVLMNVTVSGELFVKNSATMFLNQIVVPTQTVRAKIMKNAAMIPKDVSPPAHPAVIRCSTVMIRQLRLTRAASATITQPVSAGLSAKYNSALIAVRNHRILHVMVLYKLAVVLVIQLVPMEISAQVTVRKGRAWFLICYQKSVQSASTIPQ